MLSRAAIPWGAVRPVAAVALLLLCSAPADAGCGDYVHVRSKSAASAPASQKVPPADAPCSRGECDRPADSPPAPSAPVPPGPSAADAVLVAGVVVPPPARRFGHAEPTALPSAVPSSVFHPPRD